MLPVAHRIAFLAFAAACSLWAFRGFARLYRRIRRGRKGEDQRTNRPLRRIAYALITTVLQTRTFRKRPWVSLFHAFIFYGFSFYILVNVIDAAEGFFTVPVLLPAFIVNAYHCVADILTALVLLGTIALVFRRFFLPARRDFQFNARTQLHENLRAHAVSRDSVIVSAFILLHVGSRSVSAAAALLQSGRDSWQPFATLLTHALPPEHAAGLRILAYWGALGSVFAFLPYFPYTKHIHIFLAPTKYALAREEPSGVLPKVDLNFIDDTVAIGAERLEDLSYAHLLDAYACIQCNRCQDVCPATATGKSLSPSALEINKRMELNVLAQSTAFENGGPSPRPLLAFALTPEAAWACTTCGACMQVCPTQNEPMLDIVDVRRRQVMMAGEFPAQLSSAFRGMERAQNPWGASREQRLAWAEGLDVPTIEENPSPEVLYWVGCAAAYDPQSQKVARALVQLLRHAGVNFAVLGKNECCTGDPARRAGNELLYTQLAEQNISALQKARPKQIVASCPHCLNAVGREYAQLGGDFAVKHHTEILAELIAEGKLPVARVDTSITFHDPCYLGRHNGVYDAPRQILDVLSTDVREMSCSREASFCCGAGGAQFWKEEEPGDERISANRLREAHATLETGNGRKTLAVGCPFCKSMLASGSSAIDSSSIEIRDIAEILLESLQRNEAGVLNAAPAPIAKVRGQNSVEHENADGRGAKAFEAMRLDRSPNLESSQSIGDEIGATPENAPAATVRPKWKPKRRADVNLPVRAETFEAGSEASSTASQADHAEAATAAVEAQPAASATVRKKWTPGKPS